MYNKNKKNKFIKILSIVLLLLVSISSIPFASNTETYDCQIYNNKSSSKNLNDEPMYYGDDMTWDGDLGGSVGGGGVIPYVPGIPDALKDIIIYVKRRVVDKKTGKFLGEIHFKQPEKGPDGKNTGLVYPKHFHDYSNCMGVGLDKSFHWIIN